MKPPEPIRADREVKGLFLIAPVRLLEYENGYDTSIHDVYEPAFRVEDQRWVWAFSKRVKSFYPAVRGDYSPCDCERCLEGRRENPHDKEEILIEGPI